MTSIDNLIIGAGPGGLAVAGQLRKMNIDFELLESTEKIANSWHNHYERLHLHTANPLSSLPHKPFPEDYPMFVPRQQLVDYYEDYAKQFDIRPRFGQEVSQVKKEGDHWLVQSKTGELFKAKHLVVATGVNRIPHRPHWKGERLFEGEVIHSRAYRSATPYAGKKVLVIGMGNTGAEVALDLFEQGAKPTLSVRSPVNIVPLNFLGNPTQLTALKLAKLPNWFGDWLGNIVQRITIGNLQRFGVPQSSIPPAKQLRETGKTPVIDLGTAKEIKAGNIKVIGDIVRFYEHGVETQDGQYAFDAVILCTGYRALIDDFLPDIGGEDCPVDQYGLPKHVKGQGKFDGMYFIGFDNYRPGGILGIILQDSETIAKDIQQRLQ